MSEANVASRPVVGIVGLGIMGSAYARHLLAAGYQVVGYDVAEEAGAALSKAGGRAVGSPCEVAEAAEVVLVALASVAALDDACLDPGSGLIAGISPNAVVAEMGTLPLEAKEQIRTALGAAGAMVLDCPVSGTGAQADKGDLAIYASGDQAAAERIRPVFDAFARDVRYVGPFGAGIKLKYIANLLVTIHNLAAAEAMLMAEQAGLDLQMVYDAVSSGAGSSRMFEVRGPMMVRDEYEPPTMKFDVYMKDISLIMDFARDVGCPTPLMAASVPYYVGALAQGRAKQDTAGVFAVLRSLATGRERGG